MPNAHGTIYGVVFGAEREVHALGPASVGRDWTLGVHGALSGQSMRLAGDARGAGTATALDVGVHARYVAEGGTGPHAFATLRAGVKDGRVVRSVVAAGDTGNARGTWTGASAAASLAGGWRWALSATTRVGPLAAPDYAMLYRPGVSETEGRGAALDMRLNLAGQTFHSLRMRVGAQLRFALPAAPGDTWRAHWQATWSHEFLASAVVPAAAFAAAPSARFTTRTGVVGRDSLSVQAGVSYQRAQRSTSGAALLSNLYRAGDTELAGTVSATWHF